MESKLEEVVDLREFIAKYPAVAATMTIITAAMMYEVILLLFEMVFRAFLEVCGNRATCGRRRAIMFFRFLKQTSVESSSFYPFILH